MQKFQLIARVAMAIGAAALLSACAGSAPPQSIAADDDALCRYSASEPAAQPYQKCRDRLDAQRARAMAFNANQIDTSGDNRVALVRTPTDVAACKAQDPKSCPPENDVTGTIPAAPKTTPPKQ